MDARGFYSVSDWNLGDSTNPIGILLRSTRGPEYLERSGVCVMPLQAQQPYGCEVMSAAVRPVCRVAIFNAEVYTMADLLNYSTIAGVLVYRG